MKKAIKSWFPIKEIKDGIIETKTKQYFKILEISPINFELKSNIEKENIIYQYKTFLKTCNFDIQILIQSQKNNLEDHIEKIMTIAKEENSNTLKLLINEYVKNISEKTLKTTITRRFFIIFGAEVNGNRKLIREIAKDDLNEKTLKIKRLLEKCGNRVHDFSDSDFILVNNLYKQLNRKTSEIQKMRNELYER